MVGTETLSVRGKIPLSRILDIECLRAFAVIFVVLHHANANLVDHGELFFEGFEKYFGGAVGVDLFFAISGFVIARSLMRELDLAEGMGSFRGTVLRFLGRRAFRLLPSAWLWLFLILIAVLLFNSSGVFGTLEANIWATLAALLYFANLRFADAWMSYEYGASFVYWSLSLEEQFYVLLPLARRIFSRLLPVVLIAIVLYQLSLPARGALALMLRSDALCLGVLLAYFSNTSCYQNFSPSADWRWRSLGFVSMVALLALLVFVGSFSQSELPGKFSIVALLSFLLVLISSYGLNLFAAVPGSKVLIWLGARSYAIYLIHIPVFFFVRELFFRFDTDVMSQPLLAMSLSSALILVCAEANYRWIEQPLVEKGRRLFPH